MTRRPCLLPHSRIPRLALVVLAGLTILAGCKTSAGYRGEAQTHRQAGELQAAADVLAASVAKNPANSQNRYLLGKTLNELDQPLDAQTHLDVAADLLRDHPDRLAPVLDELARSYYLQGANEQLYAFLEAQTARLGTTADYLRLAEYMVKINDIDAAQDAFERAAYFAPPGDAQPYLKMAAFYESINAHPQAVEAYRYALNEAPDDPKVAAGLRRHDYVPGPSLKLEPPKPVIPTAAAAEPE